MFLKTEERPAGETAKVGKLKVSELIRRGKPFVGTEAIDFRLCALGCVWAGVNSRRMTWDDVSAIVRAYPTEPARFSEKLALAMGFPTHLFKAISLRHCEGVPALKIADELEAQSD